MADRSVSVTIDATITPYQRKMAQATGSTTAFKAATDDTIDTLDDFDRQAGGLEGSFRSITQAGWKTKAALGVGAGVGAALAASTKVAVGWESAFADVRKTVEGTPEQLNAISDGLRRMSTEIPTSAEELAGIAASAGQLGIETENVEEFTRTIADLGETTNLAGEQGATSLARLANITGMAQEDFGRLGSTIVALGNNLATTESEIAEMALRIAGAGTQVGLTEADILSFAGALSSVGVEAQAGGTSISRAFITMAEAVSKGGGRLEQFAEVAGTTSAQFQQQFEEDAAGAMIAFIQGLGNMSDAGEDVFGTLDDLELGEIRVRDALLRASNASDTFTDALDLGSKAWEENIALTEEAEKRYDTTAAKLEIAGNSIKDIGREIGGVFAPALGEVATQFTTLLNFETDFLGFGWGIRDGLASAVAAATGNTTFLNQRMEELREEIEGTTEGPLPVLGTTLEIVGGEAVDTSGHLERLEKAAMQEGVHYALGNSLSFSAEKTDKAGDETKTYTERLRDAVEEAGNLSDALRAQTDPVFAAINAIQGVDEAQREYTQAVKEYGKNSPEAEAATIRQAEAIAEMESAVVAGDMSIEDFRHRLKVWAKQQGLSRHQTQLLMEKVGELRREGEKTEGNYPVHTPTPDADKSRRKLLRVGNAAFRIPGFRNIQVSAETRDAISHLREINRLIDTLPGFVGIEVSASGSAVGDGPGFGQVNYQGSAMATARAAAQGLPVSMSSGYRSPAHNASVGGSPTSFHLDKSNPASDWVGPAWALDVMDARLPAGREKLWRTAGHYDHLHYAHEGGRITRRGVEPLQAGEVDIRARVGETVLTPAQMRSLTAAPRHMPMRGAGHTTVDRSVNIDSVYGDAGQIASRVAREQRIAQVASR